MRRFIWSLRKRLERLNSRPRVVERLGARWELDPDDWLDLRLIARQPFEAKQLEWFLGRVTSRQPSRFFDVGANMGLYSVLAALSVPGMTAEAFEPVETTRAKLSRNIALNRLEDRVNVHAVALSDSPGTAEISVDPKSSGLSTLEKDSEEAQRRQFKRTEIIRTTRLDALFPGAAGTIAIKIDVEGHELFALDGMVETLAACDGVAMVEARPINVSAVRDVMKAAGWVEVGSLSEELFFEKFHRDSRQ